MSAQMPSDPARSAELVRHLEAAVATCRRGLRWDDRDGFLYSRGHEDGTALVLGLLNGPLWRDSGDGETAVVVGMRHPNVTTILHTVTQCERWGKDGDHDRCVPVYELRTSDGSKFVGEVGVDLPAVPAAGSHPAGASPTHSDGSLAGGEGSSQGSPAPGQGQHSDGGGS